MTGTSSGAARARLLRWYADPLPPHQSTRERRSCAQGGRALADL
jgi:hypothetical protein